MKTNVITSLIISIGMLSASADPLVTTTWSDATTTFHLASFNNRSETLSYSTGGSMTFTDEAGVVWNRTATPTSLTYDGHDWSNHSESWNFGACSSGSSGWNYDLEEDYNGTASGTFPITYSYPPGYAVGPEVLDMTYSGTYNNNWILVYWYNGSILSSSTDSSTLVGRLYVTPLSGSRGSDAFINNIVVDLSAPGDPSISGSSDLTHVETLTTSVTFQASYAGPANTQASLYWGYYPFSYFGNETSDGGGRSDFISPGGTSGPGTQMSWPLERFNVEFVAVSY